MSRIGRPPTCECGDCERCKRNRYERERWNALSAERKRQVLDARRSTPEKVEHLREVDRERNAQRGKKNRERLKENARNQVYYAVGRSQLTRLPCEVCGNTRSQAHHEDYTMPLDVRWLCQKHHAEHHRKYLPRDSMTSNHTPIGLIQLKLNGQLVPQATIQAAAA